MRKRSRSGLRAPERPGDKGGGSVSLNLDASVSIDVSQANVLRRKLASVLHELGACGPTPGRSGRDAAIVVSGRTRAPRGVDPSRAGRGSPTHDAQLDRTLMRAHD
jgi:hypothetical protein